MKKLKETTIKRYKLYQLINHVNHYQRSMKIKPFRIDQGYGKIYKYHINAYFYWGLVSRDNILELIDDLYSLT